VTGLAFGYAISRKRERREEKGRGPKRSDPGRGGEVAVKKEKGGETAKQGKEKRRKKTARP